MCKMKMPWSVFRLWTTFKISIQHCADIIINIWVTNAHDAQTQIFWAIIIICSPKFILGRQKPYAAQSSYLGDIDYMQPKADTWATSTICSPKLKLGPHQPYAAQSANLGQQYCNAQTLHLGDELIWSS